MSIILTGFLTSYLANVTLTNWQDGLGILKSFLLLPIFFALAISFLIQQKKISLIKILKSYFLSSVILASGSIFYFLLGITTYDNRVALFFNSPNSLVMYLIPGFLIGSWFLKEIKKQKFHSYPLLFLIIALLFLATAIILTQSLGGWMGSGGALIFLFWPKKMRSLRKKITYPLIIALSLLTLIFIFTSSFIISKMGYSPFITPSSYDSRLVIYQVGTKIIADHWLQGIGPGNFQKVYLDYQQYFLPYPQWAVPHPHNLLLSFWLEAGFLGSLGFWLLLWNLRISFRKFRTSLGVLVGSIMLYFLIHGLVDTPFWKNDLAVIFWLIIIL
ncbi:MAG: O-antigen ligase family protein, partial [Patescibacteria group bacterium]|nr:O-antigen ligase family protein [Patescibacteria group bacterium]